MNFDTYVFSVPSHGAERFFALTDSWKIMNEVIALERLLLFIHCLANTQRAIFPYCGRPGETIPGE